MQAGKLSRSWFRILDLKQGFLSVAVITCASHAQGRRFEPGREQNIFGFGGKIEFHCSGLKRFDQIFSRLALKIFLSDDNF